MLQLAQRRYPTNVFTILLQRGLRLLLLCVCWRVQEVGKGRLFYSGQQRWEHPRPSDKISGQIYHLGKASLPHSGATEQAIAAVTLTVHSKMKLKIWD
eukprot:1151882-Pelagomonas_calceolata.AAC.1